MSKTLQIIGEFAAAATLAAFGDYGDAIRLAAVATITAISALTEPGPPDPQAVGYTSKQPTPPRVSGYGKVRLSGAYMLFDINSNGDSVDVLALHDGQVDGFETFYLNDDKVVVRSDGWVEALSRADGRYSAFDKVQILTRLGLPTETAYTTLVTAALPGWDATHRGDGIASLALGCRTPKAKYYETIYPNGEPQPSVVTRCQRVFDPRTGVIAWTQNPVLQLLDYLTSTGSGMGLDYATRILPALSLWEAAANDCDSLMPVLHMASDLSGDASKGATTLTLDLVTGIANGVQVTIGADVTNIETVTANSVSGNTLTLAAPLAFDHHADEYAGWVAPSTAPAMLPRYQAGGAFKHTDAPSDVIAAILASFDGWMGAQGDGSIAVYSGRYTAPTITLGDDAIVSYNVQHGVEDENATNVLVVQYSDPAHDYATVEGAPWRDDDDIAARGSEKSDQLALTWVQRHDQARRLAKRQMSRNTAPRRGNVTFNLAGMTALGQRYIQLQIGELGYNAPVEISRGEIDISELTVSFDWVEADPNIDAWNPVLEEGSPPPWQGRAVTLVGTPVISSVVPVFADTGAGAGSGVKLAVTVGDPGRPDITFGVRWRVLGDTSWNELSFTDWTAAGGSVVLTTGIVPANVTLEVEAEAVAGDGTNTPWSTPSVTVSTSTSTVPPAQPTGFAMANGTGKVTLSWRNPSSANLDHLTLYRSAGTVFSAATAVDSPIVGGQGAPMSVVDTVAAGTYHYWLTASNASGATCTPVGPLTGVAS